jgi:site-specific DNA-methyltransferase (adenine-specific)
MSGHQLEVQTSSKSTEWATPQKWFEYLDLEFKFTLDPCCTEDNAKCKKYYTYEDDGLVKSWREERVFMNPPYGRELGKWMQKAYLECRDNNALVVCLVPARVDVDWWHRYADRASDIRFPKGRLSFENTGSSGPAPFAVAIIIFRPKV